MSVVPLRALVRYFLWLGTVGFGGPIALVGYMQHDLTERRSWFTEEEFRRSVVFSQLAPGPLAAQVAMYLGWLRYRVLGATLTGLAFVLPSLLLVIGLAVFYERFHGLPWLRSVFYGVSAAVIAIIVSSTIKLGRLTLQRDRLLIVIFVLNAAVTAITGAERISLLLLCGLAAVLVRAPRPSFSLAVLAMPLATATTVDPGTLDLGLFFAKAGAVVFGSGLAIVPFLQSAVHPLGWLTDQQFVDAIAVSLISPGPVVITVAFMGYLIGGIVGALAAALGVFLPVYLAVLAGGPWFRRFADSIALRHAVSGIAAAAAGSLAGAAFIIAQRAIPDIPALCIAIVTFGIRSRFRRLPDPLLVLAAGAGGLVLGP